MSATSLSLYSWICSSFLGDQTSFDDISLRYRFTSATMPVIDVSSVPSYQPLDLVTRGLPLFAVLYIQAYLLLRYGSRSRTWRVGLWPLGMWLIKRAWLDRRFVDPYAIHLSFMCGCASVFVSRPNSFAVTV